MGIRIMISALLNHKLSASRQPVRLYLLSLIAALTLAGCGNQDDATNLSLNISDTVLAAVEPTFLLADITVTNVGTGSSSTQAMIISGTTASLALNNLSTGLTSFTIVFSYDDGSIGPLPLVLATHTQNLDVAEGVNPPLNFLISDFDTSFDEDGDGLTNVIELQTGSLTDPLVADNLTACILGTSLIGTCVFGP